MLVEFGRAGLLEKARQQPDKVRQVIDKARTDGLLSTIESVRRRLGEPISLGYCNAGEVVGVGAGVAALSVGDRVVSNGPHAEFVLVPANLCARIPDGVSDESAAFTVLGSIALQGIRLIAPTLGETVVVSGLGLIGQMAVQLLRANGCHVIGVDFDAAKLDLARKMGARTIDLSTGADPVEAAKALTVQRGVDAVLVTASTASSDPIRQAAQMSRKRGRIVLVGVTGLELSRADFYEKELTFQVSCSYGPGRYDPAYEQEGADYPLGFVRWTEQRNFEAILSMLGDRRIDVSPLVSHRIAIDEVVSAYKLVTGSDPTLGILLEYRDPIEPYRTGDGNRVVIRQESAAVSTVGRLGFVGAGNYASAVLIPAFKDAGASLQLVSSGAGVTAARAARKFGFAIATTDSSEVIQSSSVDAVAIATRHDSHAKWAAAALRSGKHVFVEKPLAINMEGLNAIVEARREFIGAASGREPVVMVGFNRRFSKLAIEMRRRIRTLNEPVVCVLTVNAGSVPDDHWTQDVAVGGGRIVGEACHFIDLARYLIGHPIVSWQADRASVGGRAIPSDRVTVTMHFADDSIATVHYVAGGHRAFPKERVEAIGGGRVLQIDNFRALRGWGWPGNRDIRLWRQDKGQAACASAFLHAIKGLAPAPIPWEELLEVSRISIEVAEAVR
ncbi:MAG: bi-domain-containing oxidoreductase [Steroidobacteraceae bacterium]